MSCLGGASFPAWEKEVWQMRADILLGLPIEATLVQNTGQTFTRSAMFILLSLVEITWFFKRQIKQTQTQTSKAHLFVIRRNKKSCRELASIRKCCDLSKKNFGPQLSRRNPTTRKTSLPCLEPQGPPPGMNTFRL